MTSHLHSLLTTLYFTGIGPLRLRRWLNEFGDIENLYSADKWELKKLGLTDEEIITFKNPNWKAAEKDLEWCEKNNCHVIAYTDSCYPKLLNELPDGPLILFVQGSLEFLSQQQLAIVGSRNPTVTGRETAEQFAFYLSQAGLIITSGLALGIDAAAHEGALNARQPTIAVCGSGLQYIYPKSNKHLAETIRDKGALVSEFPPFTQPHAMHFPRRNRLISGLSLGVLVVEAALKSGSLITAKFALEQGREVFALPGSIHNPLARGCHKLIREGAKLVETAGDIVEELGALQAVVVQKPQKRTKLDLKKQHVLKQIGFEITHLDAIIQRSGLTTDQLSSMLISLELEGYVTFAGGGYTRNK